MSPAPARAGHVRLDTLAFEQRLHPRYPIVLDVEYRLINRGRIERLGSGRTLNISSGGVLMEVPEQMPSGGLIELLLNWPFLLEGVCPLKLVMRGRIVRCDANGVAIKARHHEFRTAGARSNQARPLTNQVRSLVR